MRTIERFGDYVFFTEDEFEEMKGYYVNSYEDLRKDDPEMDEWLQDLESSENVDEFVEIYNSRVDDYSDGTELKIKGEKDRKYFVIYEKHGDSFGGDEPFDTKEQAIDAAERQWANLTRAERKSCNLCVAIGEVDDDGILDTMTGYDVIVQYPTRKWEVLEDNAGGLHLAVFDLEKDGVEYIHSGYETAGDQLLEDIKLLKSGEADPVNDWDGNAEDPQVIYDELVNSRETSIVADDDGVYYSKMGNSAASIFGDGENE
jgi:hypothetical protein